MKKPKAMSVLAPVTKQSPATAYVTLDSAAWNKTLFEALLDARDRWGGERIVVEDSDRVPVSYDRLILEATILGSKLEKLSAPGERFGLMLPNVAGLAAVFFGLQCSGRVPAMLNFSSGLKNLLAACRTTRMETMVTSRKFIEQAGLEDLIEGLKDQVQVVWTEDLRDSIGTFDKLRGAWHAKRARQRFERRRVVPSDTAVMLFTSGSEGVPKGVALSHMGVLANCEQFLKTEKIDETRAIFNPLPVFHSFGLTVGFIAPVVAGLRTYLYPSPLHYKQIPAEVKASGCDILVGTDTFAAGWGRVASQDDFANLTLVVLGAERVKEATRKLWMDKFGLWLLEGYGATECAPVISANTEEHHKDGSVGRLMPGMKYRIEPIPGLKSGGRLHVKGPNIMRGYMRHEAPGLLEPTTAGWHDTGDIVDFDEDGFITIQGRAKRFAKIGGEMISLGAVEANIAQVWPEHNHAVVAIDHTSKGEALVLVTDKTDPDMKRLVKWAKINGVPELMMPKKFIIVKELPVLGTGKLDYAGIQQLVIE
uniref:AMP-binding protein n=1 Tax=Pararhizobium sp. IMCC3301 TaxID=3067904 RepID=UPI00274228D5|nr:AMP-binding protein [Pararhizobium sp. IMCC3301]